AKTVLTKTKQYYHEVHLPRILQKSEEYFVYLTGGRYSKIFSPSEAEPFIVERNDGMRFYSHELSQATAEQLYLSLRFALANTFEHDYPFIIASFSLTLSLQPHKQPTSLLAHALA
ncbi:ATP-binding protein, partial [Bacillus sp. D-CC]